MRSNRSDGARPCRCGHTADVHRHYRSGSDCGSCDCPALHRESRLRRRMTARRVVAAAEAIAAEDAPERVRLRIVS